MADTKSHADLSQPNIVDVLDSLKGGGIPPSPHVPSELQRRVTAKSTKSFAALQCKRGNLANYTVPFWILF
jgi:hypothetical protein